MIYAEDCFLFDEGTNYESYRWLGAHPVHGEHEDGTDFAVWAPNAQWVGVITAKTGWENEIGMTRRDSGMWDVFVPHVGDGDAYRYVIVGADGIKRYKADPYAFRSELRPNNASIVCKLDGYEWNDDDYQAQRDNSTVLEKPMAIYEVHLGSWKKHFGAGDEDGFLNYREYADQLAEYVSYMGYTHVELMGICEYPFDGSWGYQVTGFFSPTSRYGTPDDFRYLVDTLHQAGVGVILDWVPAHFPKDSFGLESFDGTPLFESADPLRAEFPVWGTKAFDHTKPQVRSFLISSAFYWVQEFHIDALRVDAVAAMTYLDYDRSEWRPNAFGGRINLESQDFLRQLNTELCGRTTAYLIAEDSSPEWGITEDVRAGGLGFTYKWNMGWMNDTLRYISKDPIYRKYHHEELVHTIDYAFSENFVLVLSHDEVVHLKHSIVEKCPGGLEEKLGCLKALYTHQIGHPGKKLLFMGQDFAQHSEWSEKREIEWYLADDFGHRDVMETMRNLLQVYRTHPSLYSDSKNPATFEWVNRNDAWRNIVSYIRRNPWNYDEAVLVVCNFSPMHIGDYACGVPMEGLYRRVFSTYDSLPGGGGPAEIGGAPLLEAVPEECDGRPWRLNYGLRPYEAIIVEFPVFEDGATKAASTKASAATKPAGTASNKAAQKKPAAKKASTASTAKSAKSAVQKTTQAKAASKTKTASKAKTKAKADEKR
ncbi:MAG: 1,4-alpha-glucan branching protein GlgB [Atopobiaceae bacterium]|nr:1,4-alpha-glucan branching protein GlgB [Atopobiaceae bacterium]